MEEAAMSASDGNAIQREPAAPVPSHFQSAAPGRGTARALVILNLESRCSNDTISLVRSLPPGGKCPGAAQQTYLGKVMQFDVGSRFQRKRPRTMVTAGA